MSIELTVILKDEERTYKHKFLIYEDVTFVDTDLTINECVKEACENFQGEPEEIRIQALMVWQ